MNCENVLLTQIVPSNKILETVNTLPRKLGFTGYQSIADDLKGQAVLLVKQTNNIDIYIHSSWLNVIEFDGSHNEFGWHNEIGDGSGGNFHKGEFAAILWLKGDTGTGGKLEIMLPSAEILSIEFQPNKLLMFPIDYLHRVNHYNGTTPRVSLNFTFSLRRKND